VVFLSLYLVHWFVFSIVIRGSESKKVVTLGFLEH
jgi:peptidoglycan/LPS O-acetylase OafA/YrhL